MTWNEALEIVAGRTGHARYRELCADDWPDHEAYRALVIRLAAGEALNDEPDSATAGDKLAAYVAEHGCGGC
jgi:hypothetical protein